MEAPAPPPQRLTPWFGVTGLLLLATLLAAAFVQVRQYALLSTTVQYQDDYLVLSLYQLETEYLRLREQWRQDVEPTVGTPAQLQLRYDIFVSRVTLLRTERANRLLRQVTGSEQALRQIDRFTARADLYLSAQPRGPLSPQAARALLDELIALADPIHQLLLDASHQVAAQVSERQDKVRQHNQIGLALTGFLSAMVLVFAVIALRQMRKLEQRRRHLEALADELRDARIEAEAASHAKSEFLADMSHELRTPLHGLLGMLALLKQPRDARVADDPTQAAAWLQTADESAAHLLRLLDDILDLAKLESGTLSLAPQVVELPALLQEVQALMLPQATDKGLALELRLDERLPTHVRLDPTRTRQVLYNLLNNAIKFSERGSIVLGCRARSTEDGQRQLEFDVTDSGIGMDPTTVDRLFQRFTRADDPLVRRQGGTGLGLAISRNLARLMDGELLVRSVPGAGSVFSFHCPLVPAAVVQPATPAPADPAHARGLRVLVAEDHPVNRLYLGALLERLGHHGHQVGNGLEAVQAMREQAFDLVLMDVHMPVMDGVTATEAIRALPGPASRIPIIALTADVFADTRERCLRAGIDEVMTKPVSLEALSALFARHAGAPPQPAHPPAAEAAATATAPGLIDHAALAAVTELMGAARSPALYGDFFAQADAAAHRMRDAMRDADTDRLREAAHAVKGAALNLGLPALADAAAVLNRDAGTLGAPQLALAVQRFEELVLATRRLCEAEGIVEA